MVQFTRQPHHGKKGPRGGAIGSKIFLVLFLSTAMLWTQLMYGPLPNQIYVQEAIDEATPRSSLSETSPLALVQAENDRQHLESRRTLYRETPLSSSSDALSTPTVGAESDTQHPESSPINSETEVETNQCRLYLAPSSVSDNENRPAGFGIFTTVPLSAGSYVFPKGEGPSVIIPDVPANNFGKVPNWARYIFLYPSVGFNMETDDPRIIKFNSLESNMNLGALGNFHPYLKNVLFDDTDIYQDNILQRHKDPGAGAFSYHMGKKWHVTRDVEAGEELFDDYSESWFFDEELGKAGKDIPREANYYTAAAAVRRFAESLERDAKLEVQDLVELKRETKKASRRAASLMPTNVTDFLQIKATAKTEEDYVMALARRSVFNRSIAWIRENGKCLDNIYPERSTIAEAGQGAFAARFIGAGETVVPVPTLLQVADKTTLNVYKHERIKSRSGKETYKAVGEEPMTKQLVLNYCFGHETSSMVLCPATNGNLVNHCSSRRKWGGQCDQLKGPNAKLRWATEFDPETKEWLERSLEEIDDRVGRGRRGLSFEIVATRDIRPGDEIFIDYGEAWEEAWQSHIARWRAPENLGYVPVADMNRNVSAFLRTKEELEENPYKSDIRLGCYMNGFYHPCEVLSRSPITEPATAGSPLERVPTYKVRLDKWHQQGVWEFRYKWHYRHDSLETHLSSRYIRFFHGLYSSDQHIPGTFRQNIGVPDEMWPTHWRVYHSKLRENSNDY